MKRFIRLAILCSVAGWPTAGLASLSYDISFTDPGGANAAFYSDIQSNLGAAVTDWSRLLGGNASLQIEVVFSSSATPRASSASVTSVPVGFDNGRTVLQEGAAYEVRTGTDPNGVAPDIQINLNPSYVANQLWFDPNPTTRTALVPSNKTDAYSVFIHELGHDFGFSGFRDILTGDFEFASFESAYDALTTPGTSNLAFVGPHAEAVYGGPVPLTFFPAADPRSSQNIYHLGNVAPGPGQDLLLDLMNGIAFLNGTRYTISSLDVAILGDTGLPLSAVPEPGTLILLTTAGLLGALKWKRSRTSRLR